MPPPSMSYFVDEPPEFEYEAGLFHIRQRLGEKIVERVMRPHVFLLALRRAAEAAHKHRFGSAAIIPFERESDSEDVTAAH